MTCHGQKKNHQNIVETFCYLKVRLYNHEVHDFSILYETVFFACYTSQICTVQVNYSQKVVFTFHFIIWIEILHDSTYFCVEKYISIFDKMTNKRNFLKIINLYYSLFKTPQFHVPPKSNSTMLLLNSTIAILLCTISLFEKEKKRRYAKNGLLYYYILPVISNKIQINAKKNWLNTYLFIPREFMHELDIE